MLGASLQSFRRTTSSLNHQATFLVPGKVFIIWENYYLISKISKIVHSNWPSCICGWDAEQCYLNAAWDDHASQSIHHVKHLTSVVVIFNVFPKWSIQLSLYSSHSPLTEASVPVVPVCYFPILMLLPYMSPMVLEKSMYVVGWYLILFFSIAVIKQWPKTTWRGKGFFRPLLSKVRAGTQGRSCSVKIVNAAYQLAFWQPRGRPPMPATDKETTSPTFLPAAALTVH